MSDLKVFSGLATPYGHLLLLLSCFLFQERMEGLQRGRYGTMAEGKEARMFSGAPGTWESCCSLHRPPPTSNPDIVKWRRKRQLSLCALPSLCSTHPLSPAHDLWEMWKRNSQVRVWRIWNQIVKMISLCRSAPNSKEESSHRDLGIVLATNTQGKEEPTRSRRNKVRGFRRLKWT